MSKEKDSKGNDSKNKDSKDKDDGQQPPPSALEWSVRGLSAAAIIGLFAFLIHGAMQPEVGPNFAFEVQSEKIEQRRNGWAVPVRITNNGTVAISELQYQVRVPNGAGGVVAKEGRVAIFGAGESVSAEVWFDDDPHGLDLEFRVDTYTL